MRLAPAPVAARALLLLAFAGAPLAAAASPAATVSPGEVDRAVEVATPCPTFHWAAVDGAAGYEIVVLDLARPDEPSVALRQAIAGSALGWTPDRAACLASGGTFAWTVRALDAAGRPLGGEEGWAAPRQFAVPAVPDDAEVAAALDVLRRWEAGRAGGPRNSPGTRKEAAKGRAGKAVEVSGSAAIRGENPAAAGASHGVWGQTASGGGAGLVAVNLAAGPDLVLDGAAQGQADTLVSESGLDRPSGSAQTFNVQNSGGGGMSLQVGGQAVWHAGNDGPGSGLDADTLDGQQATSYQARVTGICGLGQAVQGINVDGSVVCFEPPVAPRLSTFEFAADLLGGEYSSIAIGTDGFPVISLLEPSLGRLLVAKCHDAACTEEANVWIVDTAEHVGMYTSIAIGTDGFPVISYYDLTNRDLKVAKCNDAACAGGGEIITTVDSAGQVGEFTSLAVGTDGFPVISYYDASNQDLKVVKCNDAACSGGGETISTVGSAGQVGSFTSLAIGADGFPVISYYDETDFDLKVAKCNDAACAGGDETINTVDGAGEVGRSTSIAIGADGFPVISYQGRGTLKVAKCNDAACAGGDETIATVDSPAAAWVGDFTSIALGTDGFPVISYWDVSNTALKIAKCNDAACAGGDETITTVESAGDVGLYTSIAIGADGFPVVSYTDLTNRALKVAKCRNLSCRY